VISMKVQVICGFLGAGKTTLLKNLLQNAAADTAILVNEFGELGIDGTLVSQGCNLNVVEMPSGCICCSLRESLVDGVREIMEKYNPSQLIIEPTGIASPSSIILGLKKADYAEKLKLAPVIGVIDLTFFIEIIRDGDVEDVGEFFKDQIMNSDIILLNKADLVIGDTIDRCREEITALNPAAVLIPTVYCRAEIPEVEAKGEVVHFHFSPRYSSEVFRFSGKVDRDRIETLLKDLKTGGYGDIFRAKGIILTCDGPVTFDYVNGRFEFGKIAEAVENRLVFIGRDIDRAKLEGAIGVH